MTKPIALITGITGQDGSYLTELLLSKGYTVLGLDGMTDYYDVTLEKKRNKILEIPLQNFFEN